MVLPTPGFSEAPITAIDLGAKKIELDIMRRESCLGGYKSWFLSRWTFIAGRGSAFRMSSGMLLLIVLPAVIAFAFGAFVMASIMPEIEERLYYYLGYQEGSRMTIDPIP
jgi:hypothetical protein